ncbi:MAG: hypothetical protein QW717_08015 [Candidatus Bathyarchaeia archaeon]
MGLLDTVRPVLGYVLAIAILVIIAGLGFMAAVSANITSAATTMASILVLVALLVGVAAASRVGREA